MFEVIVIEKKDPAETPSEIERYRQCVDVIDLRAVMKAVNTKPRAPRKSRAKSAEQTKS